MDLKLETTPVCGTVYASYVGVRTVGVRVSVRVCMRVRVRILVTAYMPKPPRGDSAVSGVFIKPYHFLELSIIMKNTCSPKLSTKNCKV